MGKELGRRNGQHAHAHGDGHDDRIAGALVADPGQFFNAGHGRHAEHHYRRSAQDRPGNSGDDRGQFRQESK